MKAGLRVMLVVLLLTPALVSCRVSRKPRPIPPPFRPPLQTDSTQAQKPAEPPEPAPAPEVPPSEEAEPIVLIPETSQGRLPPPPQPRIPVSPPVQQPPVQPAPPPPEAAPAIQLRPILTPTQTQELERTIAERLSRARSILRSLENRRLSRSQVASAGQIRTFIAQAEEARKTDLLRANNMAERAEVLALDLAQQMR
jgi:hypothetical protein